jgi:hypothetical protein
MALPVRPSHGDAGDGGRSGLADLPVGHVGGAAGLLQRVVDDIHGVIAVRGELVGDLAEAGLISFTKAASDRRCPRR